MTAMHCVEDATNLLVVLGEHDIRQDIEQHQAKVGRQQSSEYPDHPVHPLYPDHPDHPLYPDHPDHPLYPDHSVQSIQVERVIKRPDYDTDTINNDIALLRLSEVVFLYHLSF